MTNTKPNNGRGPQSGDRAGALRRSVRVMIRFCEQTLAATGGEPGDDHASTMMSYALSDARNAALLLDEGSIDRAAILYGEAKEMFGFSSALAAPDIVAARVAEEKHKRAVRMNLRSQEVRDGIARPRNQAILRRADAIWLGNPAMSVRAVTVRLVNLNLAHGLSESTLRRILTKHRASR